MNELKNLQGSEGFQAETMDRSRKRRSVLERETVKTAAVKKKDPKAEYVGWYGMYANEKNAAKGKLSYTRYNFYKKINFKEKIKVGADEGSNENENSVQSDMFTVYVDKDLTVPLTEKNARVGEEIQMWFPWPESKTLETPIELDDSGVFQETTSIPPHFHRARLVYFSSEPQAEKSDEARAAEAFNFIFGSNKSAYHMRDREVMSKMLTSMLASLQENDIVAEQEKNHKLKHALQLSDRAEVAQERSRLMANLIRKSVITKHGIDDILGRSENRETEKMES